MEVSRYRDVFTFSKINTLLLCPYKYLLKYIQKTPPEKRLIIPAKVGTAVHKAVKKCLSSLFSGEKDLLVCLGEYLQGERLFKAQGILRDFYRNTPEFFKREAILFLEKEFEVAMDRGVATPGLVFAGVWDRVDKNRNGLVLYEYKLSGSGNRLQLAIYAYALSKIYSYPDKIRVVNFEKGKVFEHDITKASAEKLTEGAFEKAEKIISSKNYPRVQGKHCKRCEYFNICVSRKVLQMRQS